MITLRKDLDLIANLVEDNSKVIDIGCGNGELLNFLSKNKNSKIQGLEINQKKVNKCVSCLLYTSPSPRDRTRSRMPSSA